MRLKELKQKYPKVHAEVIETLYQWGPSTKYASWMVKMAGKGEDPDKILDLVRDFHQRVKRMPAKQRDLHAFKTVESLRKAVNATNAKSKRKQKKEQKGYTRIFNGPTVEIYRIESFNGMEVIGRDTKWCLTEADTWPQYAEHLIFVVVNKTKARRANFSKFALLLNFPFSMEEEEIIGFGKIEACGRSLMDSSGEVPALNDFAIYDEQDRYDGRSPARAEILKILVGEETLNEALLPSIKEYLKGASNPVFCNTTVALAKGKSLPVGEFLKLVDVVVEHKLFNVLSLLFHPKAKTKSGRLHVWNSRPCDPSENTDFERLANSPALAIPEFLDMYLEHVELQCRYTSPERRKQRIASAFEHLRNNTHMSQETKEVAMNWIGRWVFRMGNYVPNFKKPKKKGV